MLVLLGYVCAFSSACRGQEPPRSVLALDQDWRFHLGEVSAGEAPETDDTNWRKLDVPHDYSIEGEYKHDAPDKGACAYLPGNIGWYRRTIDVPQEWAGKRVEVEFDAASRYSRVWINGHYLGERPYAYMSFGFDLTPYLHPGRNVLSVRLDTTPQPAARWYVGSGIYSHVRLVVTEPVHVPKWGIFVSTPEVTSDSATVKVQMSVANDTTAPANVRVETDILDQMKRLSTAEQTRTISTSSTAQLTETLQLANPKLWSPDSPRLYQLRTRVYRDDLLVDDLFTTFGVRSLRWDPDTAFWLNDRNIKLQGMCVHYDAGGGIGAAIPDSILRQRISLLRQMGCNAIRTGHAPFPPRFYELCDELGMMVMDEAFDGWKKKAANDYGALDFAQWWQRDLTDMVLRDRNHPSVVMWSIGNETGDTDRFGMSGVIHQLDSSRCVTGGQVLHGVDVSGFNGQGEVPGILEAFHEKFPQQPIVLTEEPHGYQTRGFYRALTWWRDNNPEKRQLFPPYATEEVFKYGGDPQYCSSYDNATVRITNRQCWVHTRDTPWVGGLFRWAGYDYLGEGHTLDRRWPARFWNPGVMDAAAFPKDLYYFYQSQWTTAPMVHLLPHWSHPWVEEGTTIPVVAYSNCDEVELLLNGKSLGRQKPRAGLLDFVWNVAYTHGELKAVGYRDGKLVAEHVFRTAGPPSQLKLSMEPGALSATRGEVTSVRVAAQDAAGEFVPWGDNRVDFKIIGPAMDLGYENGNPTDVTAHRVGWRNLFYGLARGYYQSTGEDGEVELVAASVLGQTPFKDSTTVTLATTQLALRGPLATAQDEIRYTVDGTEPNSKSKQYTGAFALTEPCTVRMLVLRAGQPLITSSGKFEKGTPPVYDDAHYEHPAAASTLGEATTTAK